MIVMYQLPNYPVEGRTFLLVIIVNLCATESDHLANKLGVIDNTPIISDLLAIDAYT